jgi:ADP-ribose pyrophosphatase YjhB (NUDIX family)
LAARVPEGPRVRVAALILLEGDIVVVRHRAGPATYHLLPGGGVDYRETLEDALVREVAEETGLRIEVGRPLLINDTIDPHGSRHVVNITFGSTVIGGQITDHPQDNRVEAVELVAPSALKKLDFRPPIADAIATIVTSGGGPALYLGSLFTDGHPA